MFFDYLLRVGSALSQLLNVVLFFGTRPNESISGRSYRMSMDGVRRWNYLRMLLDAIWRLFGQHEHCKLAYYADIKQAKFLLLEYEKEYRIVNGR